MLPEAASNPKPPFRRSRGTFVMNLRALIMFLAAALAAPAAVIAESVALKSPETRVSLLELYTSEGCYSCPPADRWLSNLKEDPRLWRQVVPLAFHVDYWDYIGWPDRFASRDYSQRQKSYARRGHVSSVYTPGLVLGGKEWRSWFFRPVLKVESGERVGALSLDLNQNQVSARFDPQSIPNRPLEFHVAVLGFDFETEVEAGENNGKTLRHDFVVLGHARVRMKRDGSALMAQTLLPEPRFESKRLAVAAWVSTVGDPYPIQAVGGWLQSP